MRNVGDRVEDVRQPIASSRPRPYPAVPLLVLAAIAAAALVARAWPIVRAGAFAAGSDYDDAVNFSAAGLLLDGLFPYRDFFYAHPPGGILALAPLAAVGRWVGYDRAFWMAGTAVIVVGALNAVLVGRLCWRAWGPAAGVTSALLYAVHPHVLVAERTTFMEPLLNLACITMANVWLARGEHVSDRRGLWTGVLAGVALSLKAWAVVWVVAVVLAVPAERRRAG